MRPRADHQAWLPRSRPRAPRSRAEVVLDGAVGTVALVVPAAEVERGHGHALVLRLDVGILPIVAVVGMVEPLEIERARVAQVGDVSERNVPECGPGGGVAAGPIRASGRDREVQTTAEVGRDVLYQVRQP